MFSVSSNDVSRLMTSSAASSLTLTSAIGMVTTGGSLIEETVTRNVSSTVPESGSVALTMMVAEPHALTA